MSLAVLHSTIVISCCEVYSKAYHLADDINKSALVTFVFFFCMEIWNEIITFSSVHELPPTLILWKVLPVLLVRWLT